MREFYDKMELPTGNKFFLMQAHRGEA